jgi:hypothetical protein
VKWSFDILGVAKYKKDLHVSLITLNFTENENIQNKTKQNKTYTKHIHLGYRLHLRWLL